MSETAPEVDPMADERIMSFLARDSKPLEYARLFQKALTPEKARLLKGLQGLQVEIDTLLQEQLQALEDIQRSYADKLKPLFDLRRELISGKDEPTEDLVSKAAVDTRPEVGSDETDVTNAEDQLFRARQELAVKTASEVAAGPGIPHFWLGALRGCNPLAERITERDEEVLKHLVDVSSIVLAKPRLGFALRFVFEKNDFIESAKPVRKGVEADPEREIPPCPPAESAFRALVEAGPAEEAELLKNITIPEGGCVLVRTVYFESDTDGDAIVCSIDGTDITWKAGKNPTVESREKKQYRQNKGGRGRQMRVVKYDAPVPSFFRMFGALSEVVGAEGEDEESILETEFDVARMLRSTVIPRAVEWYAGRVGAVGDVDADEEGENVDMEQLEQAMESGRGGKGPGAPAAKGGEKQECKQQ